MTRIDLIPPGFRADRKARRCRRRWAVRLAVAVVLVVAVMGASRRAVDRRQAELADLQHRYASLREELDRAEILIANRERLDRRHAAVAAVRDRDSALLSLAALGSALTPDSYLTELDLAIRDREADDDETLPGIRLRGRAAGHQSVGRLLRRLDDAAFDDVTLLSVDDAGDGSARSVEFEIVCALVDRRRAHDEVVQR